MLKKEVNQFQHLYHFLRVVSPKEWLESAINNISLLLLDHAHCERKAALAAINLISKYPQYPELVQLMSPLAREEMLHFEKVLDIMKERNIVYEPLKPCNYALTLHRHVSAEGGVSRLVDLLIVGAIIEARSCERFLSIIPFLEDKGLKKFYETLVKSEARHFEDYLCLATKIETSCKDRIMFFLELENRLILEKEEVFRFHSGIPDI